MKKPHWLLLIVALSSCHAKHNADDERAFGSHETTDTILIAKAHQSLQAYLASDTSDHYSPISFGELDTLYQSYAETPEGMKLDSIASYYSELQIDSMSNQAVSDEFGKKSTEATAALQDKMASYNGPWIGWIISHKFNTRDVAGTPMVDEKLYRLNKDLTVKGIVEDPLREVGN
jgi:hypothetical protein